MKKEKEKKDQSKHFQRHFQFHVQSHVTQFHVVDSSSPRPLFETKEKREGVKNWRGFPMVGNRCRKKSIIATGLRG